MDGGRVYRRVADIMYEDAIATMRPNAKAVFEHISIPPDRSFLWRLDDYPLRRGVWNYHPEVEVHLIRSSSGLAYVGDHIGKFHPGQLVLVGSNLPHNWVTPGIGARVIEGRDIVVQFDPAPLLASADALPEIGQLRDLLGRAALGLEFGGATAVDCAALLEQMNGAPPLTALALLLDLLGRLARSQEVRTLSSQRFASDFRPGSAADRQRLTLALDYVQSRFTQVISRPEVARHVGLSDSAFSRFFKEKTGNTFGDHVTSLRIWLACQLLADGGRAITDICFEAGFGNISNFNRTFLSRTGFTPSRYRRALRQGGIPTVVCSSAT